jgi:hypothetical protein
MLAAARSRAEGPGSVALATLRTPEVLRRRGREHIGPRSRSFPPAVSVLKKEARHVPKDTPRRRLPEWLALLSGK